MSQIHYFQRYTQPENVITNNTLLLFSRLYNESRIKFEKFLSNFLDGNDSIGIGLQFEQQTKSLGSVPDGVIYQRSLKVVIETKLSKKFRPEQLENHLKGSFKDESIKVMWALSPEKMPSDLSSSIKEKSIELGLIIVESTFEEVINSFRSVINDYDTELNDIIDDYEDFCNSANLFLNIADKLMLIPSSLSMKENSEHSIYYCPDDRNYSSFTYLGLYSQKAIRYIGRLQNIVKAKLNEKNDLIIIKSDSKVTPEQVARIIDIINSEKVGRDWDLRTGHQFFVVDKFYETFFEKDSPGGQQRNKFFNLSNYGIDVKTKDTSEIANVLKTQKWSYKK
jgi:hypothetical protein